MAATRFTPAEIRQLRGERTQAAFAAEVGVLPHSVYRWELPEGSPHARQPRGRSLARLQAFVARGEPAAMPAANLGPAPASLAAIVGDDPATLAIATALQRMFDGDWAEAEGVFLRALTDRGAPAAAHVIASTGLACIELLYRADGRRALAVLGQALAPSAPTLALTEAAAALAYSFPDGELFDVGRVHAYTARAELLAAGESPIASALVLVAESNAALLSGDDELLVRALARIDDVSLGALPEVPAMYVHQMRALVAVRTGHSRLANEGLDRLLANPRLAASPPLEARVCAMRALRNLDELGDPEGALVLARRARTICQTAQLAVGVHTGISLRAEAEALFRLGRMTEIAAVFAESDRIFASHGFPMAIVLPAQIRYLLVADRGDELQAMADRLAAVALPSIRALCQGYAAWFAATAALARGDDPAATMEAFAHAERACERWSALRRDVLVAYANAVLADGELPHARAVHARARRVTDQSPTAWSSAHLRRIEGALLVAEGRLDEGRTLFEAAAATFEASGDQLDAALARFAVARMLQRFGDRAEADIRRQLDETDAKLRAFGVPEPRWVLRAIERAQRAFALNAGAPRAGAPAFAHVSSLEIALQRLAVLGATPAMVLRELAAVARLITEAPVVLEAEGDPAELGRAVVAWFDVVGGNRRLRLGTTVASSESVLASLRIVALVAGLALATAELRGGDRPTGDARVQVPEVEGLIAASSAMRHVVADVARLAASRATVVVSGESGAGKELIARALHQLSPRVAAPYVAFNCAAVPHELFEGQLFGYRKGAFTGASADHVGVIRAADGGTLFLDEIGELPLTIQPKLLRFLDNAEVFPLGAARPITVDVRVVAATNRDLAEEVRRGRFREDLYYRLLVVPLVVPPLRARRDDIVPLARHFARTLVGDQRPPTFAPDALAALTAYAWPGNVRELRNVIARSLAYFPPPAVITRAHLGL